MFPTVRKLRLDHVAELGSCEVLYVDVAGASESEYEKDDESYYRDREQDLISEITPHRYRTILFRNIAVIHIKNLHKMFVGEENPSSRVNIAQISCFSPNKMLPYLICFFRGYDYGKEAFCY